MRISTEYQFSHYTSAMDTALSKLSDTENVVSSGKTINLPSDNPMGAAQVISMSAIQSALTQYQTNLNSAKGSLGYTEQSLSDASTVMNNAYQIALQGANGTTSTDGYAALASQVSQLQQNLVSIANSRDASGNYLFAGQKTTTQPFTVAGSTLTYNGDANNVTIQTGPSITMTVNSQGNALFTNAYNALETLKQNLQNGNTNSLSTTSVAQVQSAMQAFTQERGNVGSKLDAISDQTSQQSRRINDLKVNISDVQDADYATAISNYQAANTAYQAALSVASQSNKYSLLDFITG